MSYILEIEKQDKVRCPYCLSWSNKQNTICSECTTSLFDANNFGATRALFLWENTESGRLSYAFSSESKNKINHWNEIFRIQFEFFQKEFSRYSFLFKHSLLDIQEEAYKYFLSGLPMRPEVFKEYKEYDFPPDGTNETELLSFTFRTHPSPLFKALAGMALIQKGKADTKILQHITSWNAHYKNLRREKLLQYAHWSVQKLSYFTGYATHVNEVMPLAGNSDSAASWAKIFLYKADYDIQELKFALEEIILSEKLPLAISACLALRKYDQINTLLLHNLDESTIELAFVHSDERHIPDLLLFLKHAPRKYHEPIIRRCVQLNPKDEQIKTQIVTWLLGQNDAVLLEVLFAWKTIPRQEEIIARMIQQTEGIQALLNFLPSWMLEHRIAASQTPGLGLLLDIKNNPTDTKVQQLLLQLQSKVQEIDFELLCEAARKDNNPDAVKKLFAHLFSSNIMPGGRQITEGFYSLTKVAENTKATDIPYFIFDWQQKLHIDLAEQDFHLRLTDYMGDDDAKGPVSNWLFAIYEMLSDSKINLPIEAPVFEKHIDFALREIHAERMNTSTGAGFLKLLLKRKEAHALSPTQKNQLEEIVSKGRDFEFKYWAEQLMTG